MNMFFYSVLFVLGTIFGSFASVVIYRIKSGEKGIFMGRSHCSNCERKLTSKDLIPLFGYIATKGTCQKCKKKIPIIYPILEVSMGILFALIGYFLIDFGLIFAGNGTEIFKLLFWLFIGFVTIVYTFYDILFLEIPESILAIGIIGTLGVLTLQSIFPGLQIINVLPIVSSVEIWHVAAVTWSIVTVGILYTIMLKELSELWDIILIIIAIAGLFIIKYIGGVELSSLAITSGTIGALGIFIFFFAQILVSKGAWMGGGDLRIAILIGLMLGTSLSFAGMMLTYMIGSVIGIGFILYARIGKGETTMNTQIPFGPFLAAGFFMTIFFQETILKFISFYL